MAVSNVSSAYLDNSATTKVDPKVVEAMLPYFTKAYGNPSSLHSFGVEAREAVETAREEVAKLINAKPSEIVFTSGGTESDNLAVAGAAQANPLRRKILCSNIEHPAVLETCRELSHFGFQHSAMKVDADGFLTAEEVATHLSNEVGVASVMLANNEIGTVQPVAQIAKLCHEQGAIFHTDAVQATGKVPIDVRKLDVDLLSIASHKFHGPKGVGALFVRDGVKLRPIFGGGGHERGIRSGTENVPGIAGFAAACKITREGLRRDIGKMTRLRDKLADGLLSIPQTFLNGARNNRLPNNVNVRFLGVEGESLVMLLDEEGIAASTGSACSSKKLRASHVLLALGLADWEAHGSLRLTLSRMTTEAEIDYALEKIPPVVDSLRKMSPVWGKIVRGEKVEDVAQGGHAH